MTTKELRAALKLANTTAREIGLSLKKNLNSPKRVNHSEQHDIKLELDVRSQKRIERRLRRAFPGISILGEEESVGESQASYRWVVDPIDGTVNFTYGIPHACISIALQRRIQLNKPAAHPDENYESLLGLVYDPFTDEMFTAIRGQSAMLNGRKIHVSDRDRLDETIVSVGFSKTSASLEKMLPHFNQLVHRVRKVRIMGAAALAMVYVASGRFDAYVESGVRLWDIAAGGLILECAQGEFWNEPVEGDHAYKIIANNGKLRTKLQF